jgi:hypothetical protein
MNLYFHLNLEIKFALHLDLVLTWIWFECVGQDFYSIDVVVSSHLSMNMWFFCLSLDFFQLVDVLWWNDCGHTKTQRQQPFDYKKKTTFEIELELEVNISNNNYFKLKISTTEGSKKLYVVYVGK